MGLKAANQSNPVGLASLAADLGRYVPMLKNRHAE